MEQAVELMPATSTEAGKVITIGTELSKGRGQCPGIGDGSQNA